MKKIIILISLFLMTSALAYSHYFVIGLYVPLGGSIPGFLPNKLYEPATIGEEKWSFEMGVIFQPGLYFELGKFHYIAVSLDFAGIEIHLNFRIIHKNLYMNLIVL